MTSNALFQMVLYVGVLLACVVPLGRYMTMVFTRRVPVLENVLGPVESLFYRLCGVRRDDEMTWKQYSLAVIAFSLVGILFGYLLQRMQGMLPLNPAGMAGVSPDSSFNTAISFVTNTNWQGYGGESTMSYLTQMLFLNVQNFVSAAVGIAVVIALARGFRRKNSTTIGNFWVDLTRCVMYVLLPLSLLLAVMLVSQGVVQTFDNYASVDLKEPVTNAEGESVATQTIALGPAASQIAIKQLGTNGGGFFNVNSAHPLENPTPWSNFLEMIAILLIPAALCYTFGEMVGDMRQGWAILIAMTLVFVGFLGLTYSFEQAGNPTFATLGVDQTASELQSGGNMEGKETRFGIANSVIWATATTAASNGSVNSMHDSYTPLGGMVPMVLMQLGEVIFGGAGSGLYGMVVFAIVAVFISGLMVGRTPEYIGKKIGAYEMKMASLVILAPCAMVLVGTAIAVSAEQGRATIFNPGAHGFSEVLYAFSSASNNNGSAFAGLGANTPFYNGLLGVCMLVGRFWVMLPVLAIAGSLAAKKSVPVGPGTLPTHTPLFVFLLISVVMLVGALSFLPSLALGPIVEHLILISA
jgi:K+-transporting ATPase ATPase A chain